MPVPWPYLSKTAQVLDRMTAVELRRRHALGLHHAHAEAPDEIGHVLNQLRCAVDVGDGHLAREPRPARARRSTR